MPTNIHRNYTEKKTNYIFILPLLLILVSSSIYSCSKKKKIEPQILQVSPDVVWSGEDNQVEIFGKNFIEGAKLNIKEDKKEASIFSVYLLGEAGKIDVPFSKENEEKVKAVIKKGTPPGNYEIFVEIGNKQKASYPIKVLRLPIPYIEKISRDKVSNISEQIIILEGKNFQEITKVYIGDKEAEFSFSETQVVIKIPPDFPPGDYEIKVVNSEGSYALYSKISVVEGAKIEYKVQKPQNIFANSNTQFSVQITNKGKAKANIKISLNIDGNIKQIQTEISPEETKEVNFEVFVSANLEFELIIEGEDELGGVFSISSKETMIANCSPEICDGKDNDCNGLVDDGVLITFYKDNDGDGYGDPNSSIQACSQPAQYVQNSDDCNDNNNLINPNAIWFKDYDGDGFTDGTTQISCPQPTGYVLNAIPGDCNDNNSNINPNTTWFKDADEDGFTDGTFQVSCVQPAGFVLSAPGGDCDDSDPARNPGQSEICDGKDNNCDGQIDEGVLLTFYRDQDGDGYGNANNSTQACLQPGGYVQNPFDCNDNNASIYPGAPLNCSNGQDNDCSGQVERWFWQDVDGDTFTTSVSECANSMPSGFTSTYNPFDCDDGNASINPNTIWFKDADFDNFYPAGGSSVSCTDPYPENSTYSAIPGGDCDDNNANLNPNTIWFKDADLDGFYPAGGSSVSCSNPFAPNNATYVAIPAGDCNDTNSSIYPGAPLNCNNGQDNDCSGNIETWAYTDQDGDKFAPNNSSSCVDTVVFPGKITAGQELGYNDCNDTNSSIYPGAPLNCNNGQDNDCSGNVEKWAYTDQDGDRYAPNSTSSCVDAVSFPGQITVGQEFGTNDCNDNNSAINPGAGEVCNGIDDNCNGQADEGLASCEIPTCPTTISALSFFKSSTGDISISLSWNDPATNESGFVIEKSKTPTFSPSVSFVINAPNTTSYTLNFQEPLTQFYFRVYAFNPTGSCVPIATASTYTPPGLLWAFPLTGAPQDANGFAVNPKMFDINGDGKKEIIIADDQGYVYVISTVEYNLQISSIPLWISRPGGNVEILTPAIAVYQGNPTVVVSDQVNKKIHILGKDGNLVMTIPTITLTQTPYPPIITDFNGDLLPDILVSVGDGGLVAYSFSGVQIFSVPAPGGEKFFFPSIFEYKGSSTYIVLGTNRKRIKGFSGNAEILNIDLSNLPFTDFNPFEFISTFKIGNLSHAAFSTQDGFLHIIRLVKNPLIKFNTNQNVVAKPLSYDFNNDGTPDIAINSGNTLFFIDGKTGNQICQFNLGSASYSSPALLTDIVSVVVGTDGGRIYAIKPNCTPRWSYLSGFQIRSSPLVADIDKDGTIEIVVGAESAAAGKIIILKSDGTLEREITSLKPIGSSPKMGDMNGDGIYEVVIGTDQIPLLTTGGVLILNCPTDCASSYNLTSYTATGWGEVKTTPLLYDLNSDGFLDIVFADDSQKLYAMSGTSINYSQPYLLWSANFAGVGQMAPGVIFPSSPTLFIKSGVPYIAIGSKGNGLYIINGLNGLLENQLSDLPNCFSSPATFDYNKDGVGDIVVGCDDKNVYFVSGTDYSTMRIEETGGNIRGSPAIYDIDQDGFEDVGIGSDDNNLYVFNGVKIHLCSTNLEINLDNQPAFYKNKIVVSSDLNSYVISATDCSQISSIFVAGPSCGASFGVYMENNSPRLVVGSSSNVFVFDESFAKIYPFPFTYSGGSIASSPVLGDIDGDGSLEFSIAFVKGAAGTIFAYRVTRDVDFSLEWGEFAHDRYNSSFSEQKENLYFSPRYTSKPSDTENIYLTQEHKEKSAVGCSSFRETALLFLFFTLFIVRRKILFSRNQNLKRRKIYG
jgi:hypothetical protein